jgi:hypothetical protein
MFLSRLLYECAAINPTFNARNNQLVSPAINEWQAIDLRSKVTITTKSPSLITLIFSTPEISSHLKAYHKFPEAAFKSNY